MQNFRHELCSLQLSLVHLKILKSITNNHYHKTTKWKITHLQWSNMPIKIMVLPCLFWRWIDFIVSNFLTYHNFSLFKKAFYFLLWCTLLLWCWIMLHEASKDQLWGYISCNINVKSIKFQATSKSCEVFT